MKRHILGLSGILIAAVVCVCCPKDSARAFPEPAVVQGPDQWTLDMTFEHPQQITVKLSGRPRPQRFWYLIATITNNAGHDVDFYPRFELMTDQFQIIQAQKQVPNEVFGKIKLRHQSKYPFLESLERTRNRVLQGPDYTKDIAIIWPDFDPQVKSVKIFLTGLSNETAAIAHPVARDENHKPLRVVLAKTLELSYAIGGSPARRDNSQMSFKNKRWVMR